MADLETGAIGGVREAIAQLGRQLEVRDDVVRLDEKMKGVATREEMNDADFRTERNVGVIIDRSATALQQYVRDRVNESSLKTENSLQLLEKHLKEHQTNTTASAVASALAPVLAQLQSFVPPQQSSSQSERGGRVHPFISVGGGGVGGMTLMYLILAFLGMVPRPGG